MQRYPSCSIARWLPCVGVLLLIAEVLCGWSRAAWAADTTEPFAVGATDLDMYMAYEGLGRSLAHHGYVGDLLLGYGITDRLSGYLGVTLGGDGVMTTSTSALHLGMFLTVVEGQMIDLDLFFDMGTDALFGTGPQLLPGIEVNLDGEPDMSTWGLYARLGVPVHGRVASVHGASSEGPTFCVSTLVGLYSTPLDGHQLLVEGALLWHPVHSMDYGDVMGAARLALGYNVEVSPAFELVTEVATVLPHDGASPSLGVMVGLIATMPVGGM